MFSKVKKQAEGFTIIEVLIVLAIAGLIMLIVFLAVPALQRNSRNTAWRNDVANTLGGINEYMSANNGSLPTGVSGTGTVTYSGVNQTTTSVQGTTQVQLGAAYPATTGIINIQLGNNCAGTGGPRNYNAKYLIEKAGGTITQCQDS